MSWSRPSGSLLAGGATYVLARNEVGKVVEALGQTKAVKVAPKVLAPTSKGAPETLLLIGNDERPPPKDNPSGSVLPHSNEMLLVRIDPSKPTISMLSIPRELQVTFTAPNGEVITNRINSAYTYGYRTRRHLRRGQAHARNDQTRARHSVSTTCSLTNFKKFKRAVDEMGCVYMTVDKRYYHVNEPGGEQYFEINLQPGYQRLCGKEALEFVANRHENTSLIRDARDQRFLLEVKAEYGATLFENREKFERILGKAVETDLHGSAGPGPAGAARRIRRQAGPSGPLPRHAAAHGGHRHAGTDPRSGAVVPERHGRDPQAEAEPGGAQRPLRSHAHGSAPALSLTPTSGEALAHARESPPSCRSRWSIRARATPPRRRTRHSAPL